MVENLVIIGIVFVKKIFYLYFLFFLHAIKNLLIIISIDGSNGKLRH